MDQGTFPAEALFARLRPQHLQDSCKQYVLDTIAAVDHACSNVRLLEATRKTRFKNSPGSLSCYKQRYCLLQNSRKEKPVTSPCPPPKKTCITNLDRCKTHSTNTTSYFKFLMNIESNAAVEQVKPPPVLPASHVGVGSHPGCSTS